MDNQYSWYTVEQDSKTAYLYLNNKKGLHKLEFKCHLEDMERLQEFKTRREESKERIGKALAEAIKWAMENPEEFKARMNKKEL
jgi:hypothetical protein